MIDQYFAELDSLVRKSDIVTEHTSITYDQRTIYEGYVRGVLSIIDGTILHIREYVDVRAEIERYMYSYHYQQTDGTLIFRYDNVEHYPNLSNFPHHKHEGTEENVQPATPPDLASVLAEIRQKLSL